MLDKAYDFDISDGFIHELASAILLSDRSPEFMLTQDKYAYRVRGGSDGHLYHRKGASDNWILIANWCFYGLYIVVRYRKPVWLEPMYQSLFAKMNFVSVTFFDRSIELIGTEGEILRGRKFRLSPPSALSKVMTEKFGYTQEKVEELKATLYV
ncbi:MAG: hypothetical protein ABSF21_02780 [Dehalococcoidia bacterium]